MISKHTNTNKSNRSTLCRNIIRRSRRTRNRDNKLRSAHSNGSEQE